MLCVLKSANVKVTWNQRSSLNMSTKGLSSEYCNVMHKYRQRLTRPGDHRIMPIFVKVCQLVAQYLLIL